MATRPPTSTGFDPLVLVPGLMCDHAVWAPVLPALAAGRRCHVIDHGDARSLATMASRLLDSAPARFALAGHSMGARVALEVVRQAPARVSRLALLDTGYLPRPAGAAVAIKPVAIPVARHPARLAGNDGRRSVARHIRRG